MQRRKRSHVSGALIACDELIQRSAECLEVAHSTYEFNQIARLQEHQATSAMVVGKGPEGFVAERHLVAQAPAG